MITRKAILSGLAVSLTLFLSGCGDDESSAPSTTSVAPLPGTPVENISANGVPAVVIFGPEVFQTSSSQWTSLVRTLELGDKPAGKYLLKIQNGNLGPHLLAQCEVYTVVEQKRQCQYNNLIESTDRSFSRVEQANIYINGKKIKIGTITKSRPYIEVPIDLVNSNQLRVDLLSYPSSSIRLTIEEFPTDNLNPKAFFALNRMSGAAPLTVTFNAADSFDPEGGALSYEWDFGAGFQAGTAKITQSFPEIGEHLVKLRVTDSAGGRDEFPVTLVAKKPATPSTTQKPIPKLSITYPDPLNLRKVHVSTVGSYDLSGAITKTEINFGDKFKALSSEADHEYAVDGTFLVTVRVTNEFNVSNSIEQGIQIVASNVLIPQLVIFGPKNYSGSFSSQNIYRDTVTVDPAEAYALYQLTIKNADGEPHTLQNCSLPLAQRIACLYSNLIAKTYVTFNRVDWAHLYIDGQRVTVSGSIDKNKNIFQTYVKIKPQSQIETRLRGWPTAFAQVQLQKISTGHEMIPPLVSVDKTTGTRTTSNQLQVTVADDSETTTDIYSEGVLTYSTQEKTFSVPLTEGLHNLEVRSRDIYQNNSLPVFLFNLIVDSQAPLLTTSVPETLYLKSATAKFEVTADLNEPGSVKVNSLNMLKTTTNGGLHFSLLMAVPTSGAHDFVFEAQDLAGNKVTQTKSSFIVIDSIPPKVTIGGDANILTNQGDILVPILVDDTSPTNTVIKVNGVEILQTGAKNFSANVYLTQPGANYLEVQATDLAGNKSTIAKKTITKDLTLPVLTITSPTDGKELKTMIFTVSGKSNKILRSISVNGLTLSLNADRKTFTGSYIAPQMGPQTLTWMALDLAGNTSVKTTQATISIPILTPSLVTLRPDASNSKILVVGSVKSARPGVKISTYTGIGLFSDDDTLVKTDGSFQLRANIKPTVTIKAKDLSTGETAQITLNFRSTTSLAGIVKDSDDNPLPGVTVSLQGASLTQVTDGTGAFNLPEAPSGDQTIIFDGTTIPQAVTGPSRKFSLSKVKYSLGLNQRNVLSRPIYMTPVLMDGSESQVTADEETYVSSPAAPGFELTVTANTAQFPTSYQGTAITAKEIPADRTTAAPPLAAEPTTVIALEPSGLHFTQRAEVILPNYNELAPNTEVIILSMNSTTGQWEIDGAGKVSSNGSQIQTKPGMGISHFSSIYAVPAKPYISEVGDPNLQGIDISKGSLVDGIQLPSYKTLGQAMSPGLVYKTSWANPTAYVTNRIDIPKNTLKTTITGESFNVTESSHQEIKVLVHNTDTTESNFVPDMVRSQIFVGNLVSGITQISDSTDIPANRGDVIPGGAIKEGVNTEITQMAGIPNQGVISYAVPLKDPNTNESLPSGKYPYLARYEFRLKNLIMRSFSSIRSIWSNGTYQDASYSFDQRLASAITQVFPQDLAGAIVVQNKSQSEFGKGWKLNIGQTILNPESSKMIIEEGDGSLSSYSSNSTISTVFNFGQVGNLIPESVNLFSYPTISMAQTSPGNAYSLLTLFNASSGSLVMSGQAPVSGAAGYLQNSDTSYCPSLAGQNYWCDWLMGPDGFPAGTDGDYGMHPLTSYLYQFLPKIKSILPLTDGSVLTSDSRQNHLLYSSSGGYFAGGYAPISSLFAANTFTMNERAGVLQNFCNNATGQNCFNGTVLAFNTCKSGWRNGSVLWLNYSDLIPWGVSPPSNGGYSLRCFPQAFTPNFMGSNAQSFPYANYIDNTYRTTAAFNDPGEMRYLPDGRIILIDKGNNRIRQFDMGNQVFTTFAGDGSNYDGGNNVNALHAQLYHPQALHVTHDGVVYVASEKGLIRKIDQNGVISLVGGMAVENGGILAFEGPMATFALNNPQGITADEATNTLYISDTGNNRIVKFDLNSGLASVVGGTGNCSPGPISQVRLALDDNICQPVAITLDENKNILFFDSGAKLLRKINLSSGTGQTLVYTSGNKDLSKLTRLADGSFIREYRNGGKAYFDRFGKQTQETDRAGHVTTFEYIGSRISRVVDPTNRALTINYTGAKVSSLTDPAGRTTVFRYSGDTLTAVDLPDGTTKSFAYDANGQMTQKTEPGGTTTNYTYNKWNRLETVTDSTGKTVTINDSVTGSMSNDYTGSNIGQFSKAGVGETDVKDKITDPKNNTIEFSKDENGFIVKSKNAKGEVTTIQRDLDGRPTSVTYADGAKVTYQYDPSTQDLISTTDVATGITESQTYNAFGAVTSQTNGNGVTFNKYYYDSGLLWYEANVTGASSLFSYNNQGLPITKTIYPNSSSPRVTQYSYDSSGNLLTVTDSDGKSTSYVYDGAGNVTQSTTGNATTNYRYDSFNRLLKVISPNQETTEYTYLPSGNLSQIKDPKGKIRTFEYDQLQRLIRKTDANNKVWSFQYDANGNLTAEVDPNGNTKSYSYDELNRMVQAQFPDDLINYQYNVRGEVIAASNNNSSLTYIRDSKGRPIYARLDGLGAVGDYPQVEISQSFDGVGNRVQIDSSLGQTAFSFDQLNRLYYISQSNGDTYGFGYDASSKLINLYRPGNRTQFDYTASGMISQIYHYSSVTGQPRGYSLYTYDSRNLPIKNTVIAGDLNYSYDLNGQLKTVTGSQTENFSYDSIGNRVLDNLGSYTYDSESQRLTEDWQYNYTYDNSGNLIGKIPKDSTKPAYVYSYSSKNQLIRIQSTNTALGPVVKDISYTYDVLGRRIEKRVSDLLDSANSKIRRFVYDGDNILAEYDSSNLLATYLHSPMGADDVLSASITSDGVSAGLAQSSGKYYYLKDQLGSITDVIRGDGEIVQRYEYTAFGMIKTIRSYGGADITSAPLLKTSFAFTGREFDDESGLYFYRARTYDPQLGRFLQQDPDPGRIINPSSFNNKYTYCYNNPIALIDPSGKTSVLGWILALAFPIQSFIAINTTNAFQTAFGFSQGDKNAFNFITIAATVIGASILTGGTAGAAVGGGWSGAIAGAGAGAATGALVGGTGSQATGLGTFDQGAVAGGALGAAIGGYVGYFGSVGGAINSIEAVWNSNLSRIKSDPLNYFFNLNQPQGFFSELFGSSFGGPSLGGVTVIYGIKQVLGDPKSQGN